MITSFLKIPLFRYGVIVLLFFLLCGTTFYFSNRYAKAQRIQYNIEKLLSIRAGASQIDSCILTLYSADNDTRLFSVTGNPAYLRQFSIKVKAVDSVLANLSEKNGTGPDETGQKIQNLLAGKSERTKAYLRLRKLSDSLMATSLKGQAIAQTNGKKAIRPNEFAPRTDTVVKPKGKKLLGRLIGAFSKNRQGAGQRENIPETQKMDTDLIARQAAAPYVTHYRKLNAVSSEMKASEREMLYLNSSILQELITTLKGYKTQETNYLGLNQRQLKGNLELMFSGFSELTVLTLALFIGFIATMLYNLWKIFRHERWLIGYGTEANLVALEKSTFLANMSHEIRTPLNSIAGFAEQLEHSPLNTQQARQIKAISSSASMLLNVVNQVLEFSKYENGKMSFENSPFKLHRVIREIIVNMSILAEQKEIYLNSELKYDEGTFLVGDEFRLRQVMVNLVGNAIKFTHKGGIDLKVWLSEMPGSPPELNVSISDTGMGISAAHLPFIFKEFTQAGAGARLNRNGTGLGLAISKSIIEQQGGTIDVTSELDKGTEFKFHLPFKYGQMQDLAKPELFDEKSTRNLLRGKHVLLAEDNSMNVLLATTILRKWDMTYQVAYNGKEALLLFETTNFDLILTDIQMPEMDGVELTFHVRNVANLQKANIPVLAITANVNKEDHDAYIRSGINAIALKPFFEKELIDKIGSLLKDLSIGIAGSERAQTI